MREHYGNDTANVPRAWVSPSEEQVDERIALFLPVQNDTGSKPLPEDRFFGA